MAPQHRASKVSVPAGRQLHCMRESTETAHQVRSSPPERERWNSGKSEPSKSSAPRSIEPGSGESPEWNRSAASSGQPPRFRSKCRHLIYLGGPPPPRAVIRWHREDRSGKSSPAALRWHSGGQRALQRTDRLSARQTDSTWQSAQSERCPRNASSLRA